MLRILGVFLFIFGLYLHTTSPTLALQDSGELISCGYTLGIAHPPGYPLFCLINRLVSIFLPLGNIGYRMNILVAITAGLTIVFIFLLVYKLTNNWISSIIAGLYLGIGKKFWQLGTLTEKYMLNALFFCLLLYILICWYKQPKQQRFLYLFFFFLGLSFTHHMQTIYIIPGAFLFILIIFFLKLDRTTRLNSLKKLSLCILLFVLPLFLWFYLLIRSAQMPYLNWGNPAGSFLQFLLHIQALEYKHYFTKAEIFKIFSYMKTFFFNSFGIILPILAFIGIIFLILKERLIFLLLILSAFVNLYQVIHYDIYNIEDYFLPVFCISSICLGYADFSFAKKIFTKIVFRTLVIIFLYLLFSKNLFFANKHNFFFAYDYAKNILSNLKENAGILFTRGDDHIFPIWYLQTVEKRNRAMPCIDTVLLTYNWYVTKLANDYPYLGIDKQKFKDYLYLPQDLINELIKDIIQNNHKTREIYSTPKDRFIKENFKLIPYNVFSLVLPKEAKLTESKLNSINEICLNLRGVKDKKIFKDERVELGIITDYKLACFNKALLFYKYKLYEKAKNWLNEVLQIAPKDENVHLYLAIIHQTTKNYKKALENYEKLAKIYQENNQLNKLIQVYKNMADIYYNNLKDIENTIKYCHEILKLNPQDKVIKQTLQRLQYLMQSQ